MTRAIIDLATIRRLKDVIGGDTDDLTELINDFVSTLPMQVERMKAHSAGCDWKALRITSHSCKSNSRDLGALRLGDLCAELELQCKAGAPTGLGDQLDAIFEEANAVHEAMSNLDPEDV